jgi:C4-dicarboxylate-specific signal transduction histidine kinase
VSLPRIPSLGAGRERIEKDDMTYAMLGIAAVVALMLGVALWRYRRSVMRKREIRWLDEHHVLDRLRKHLEPSVEK